MSIWRIYKGIILTGGAGTCLHPITLGVLKQVIPVYHKPMHYCPLSTLLLTGIRVIFGDKTQIILVITTPHEAEQFTRLLGVGSQRRTSLTLTQQPSPDDLVQAFTIS